jgi:5-amino-6-(5-phosphoribosylamino)uracil reductase
VVGELTDRGVERLMVEGGGRVLTEFLTTGLADELQLVIAPFFVGDSAAPRFVHDGQFPWGTQSRATLASVETIGNVVLHTYLLSQSAVDRHWLARTIELSHRCPPSTTAFSVGAVIVDASGEEIAWGFSRETDELVHAEESALAKLGDDPGLSGATIYSSMEPCSRRRSRPKACARLIREAGIRRVVFALREPPTFVVGEGAEELTSAGVTIIEYPDLGDQVREANRLQLSS